MANKPNEQELRQQKTAEAVSKTELFFQKNAKLIYGCVAAVLVIALAILAYNRFIYQPKKAEAQKEMFKAEQKFAAGDFELALNGDDNNMGFEEIISTYGDKAGEAVYLYAGACALQTGDFDKALKYFKKYAGEDKILLSRALRRRLPPEGRPGRRGTRGQGQGPLPLQEDQGPVSAGRRGCRYRQVHHPHRVLVMGRAFEFRKERKMKRWGHMAKTFTKLGKEITIAVKQGGPEVTGNPRLRALIAEAKSEQMPKENIERAIKKATEAKSGDFKEIIYEGFGPFGIAYLVEAATDNNTRTVANVRSYFTKCGGSLQTSGSVAFMFDHKCVFRIKEDPAKPIDLDELELELIDFGADEVFRQEIEDEDENVTSEIVIYGDYTSYGQIQKYIEENGYELASGGFEQIPNVELKDVTDDQRATLDKLTGLLEDDEDVTNVYTTMKPAEE